MIDKTLLILISFLTVAAALVFFFEKRTSQNFQNGKIVLTASFYPLAEFAKNVGGDMVQVYNLTPAGTEPHDFEPTPQDILKIQKSKIFIYNDAGFDSWADKITKTLGSVIVVNASKGINLINNTIEGKSFPDPHFWLDPKEAATEVGSIKDALIKVDPKNKVYYEKNASSYIQKLQRLDKEFTTSLKSCKSQTIIASHNSLSYLARRYNLIFFPISGLSPDAEPTPQKLADLTTLAKKENVKYIFFETLVSPSLANTLASEIGAKTMMFNPIEGLTKDKEAKGEDYLSLQQENLKNLIIALECQPQTP